MSNIRDAEQVAQESSTPEHENVLPSNQPTDSIEQLPVSLPEMQSNVVNQQDATDATLRDITQSVVDESALPPPSKKAKMSKDSSSVSPPIFTTERTLENASLAPSSSSTSRAGTPNVLETNDPSLNIKPAKRKYQRKSATNQTKDKPSTKSAGRKKKVKVDRAASSVPSVAEGLAEEEGQTAILLTEETQEKDTKLYCICQALYDEERMMIACDRCDDWYHTACMKIQNDQAELVDVFICPNCEKGTIQRTTWKPKCIRNDCNHAALQPLSRYCSERCGILVAAKKIKSMNNTTTHLNGNGTVRSNAKTVLNSEKVFAEKLLGVPRIASAKRREGISIWSSESNQDRLDWLTSLLGRSTSDQISSLSNDEIEKTSAQISTLKDHERFAITLPLIEEIVRLQKELQQTYEKRNSVNRRLDLLAARIKLLHLAEDRASLLEPIRGEEVEMSTSTKGGRGKKKTKVTASTDNSRGQPRCGYDERLHWSDSNFQEWSNSEIGKEILAEKQPLNGILDDEKKDEEEAPKICGHSKRKCKRHADWSIVRGADFDVDRERQTQILSDLANDVQELELRMKTVKLELGHALTDENDRRKQIDERLARSLANEGTRRAAIV